MGVSWGEGAGERDGGGGPGAGVAQGVGQIRFLGGESGVGCKSRDGKNQAGGAAGTLADSLKLPQERITTKCSAKGFASAQRMRFSKAQKQDHTANSDVNVLPTETVIQPRLSAFGIGWNSSK